MKKIFSLLVFLIAITVCAQDSPSGFTENYHIRKWAEDANPTADSLNANSDLIDNVLYDLQVYTDSLQMTIRNDTLIFSNYMSREDTFVTTATFDSVALSGFDSLDVLVVTPLSTAYNVNDILFVEKRTGYFKVYRNSAGTSGLKYNYVWIRKYQ